MNATLLLVGIGGGLAHSLYSLVSKFVLKKRISTPLVFLLYISLLQAVLTPLLWLFIPPIIPAPAAWIPIVGAAATCAIAYIFLYASLACGDVSSVMPMMGSKVIFSGLLAHLMLGESHGASMYLAALLVAVSVAALSYSPSGKGGTSRAGLAAILMLACCVIFALTDILIKRSLAYIDSYSFLVYYNALVAISVLPIVPWLRRRGLSAAIGRRDLLAIGLAAGFLIAATLLFIRSFNLAEGIILPNILVSTRGVFIVILTALVGMHRHTALDVQSKWVFVLRLGASALLIFSIWLALRKPAEDQATACPVPRVQTVQPCAA